MNEKEIIQYAINNIQKSGTINVEWKELMTMLLMEN